MVGGEDGPRRTGENEDGEARLGNLFERRRPVDCQATGKGSCVGRRGTLRLIVQDWCKAEHMQNHARTLLSEWLEMGQLKATDRLTEPPRMKRRGGKENSKTKVGVGRTRDDRNGWFEYRGMPFRCG